VLLPVDGLGGLDVLLGSDVLLDDLGGGLGADFRGVSLVGSLRVSNPCLSCTGTGVP
jgi:hypothetical protein